MSNIFDEYGKDTELGFSPLSQPEKVKKNGWAGRIVAFILGFIIAVGGCFGGVFILLNQPLGTILTTVTPLFGMNYDTQVKDVYLSEEYGGYTLQELPAALDKALSEKTLGALADIVPYLEEVIVPMVENLNEEVGVSLDAEKILSTTYEELPTYLSDAFLNAPLGEILTASKDGEALDASLMELCYGYENYDYTVAEDGAITMINGAKALTVKMLLANTSILNHKVSVASILDPGTNAVYLPMSYGLEHTTFEVERDETGKVVSDANGKAIVTMLPLFYLKSEDGTFCDYEGAPVSGTIGETTEDYVLFTPTPKYDGAAQATYYLVPDAETGRYYAYLSLGEAPIPATFRPVTLADLSGNSNLLVNHIYLKDALNVYYHNDGTADPHKILFSLAYGTKDVDYKVVTDSNGNKSIEMLGDSTPRTIGDLRSNSMKLINNVALSDIITSDPDNAIIMYLLYGKENLHYEIADDGIVKMLQRQVSLSNDGGTFYVYNEYGELLTGCSISEIEEDVFVGEDGFTHKARYLLTENGESYYLEVDPLGKTVTTKDGKTAQVCYVYDTEYGNVNFERSTIQDLSSENSAISNILDRITVNDAFGMQNVGGNKFLRHLGDCTIKEIPDEIENLTVGQIFTSDIFLADTEGGENYHGYYLNKGEAFDDANGDIIYKGDFYIKVLKEGSTTEYNYYHFDPLTTFDSAEHELAVEEKYGVTLNVELNKQWKYLLNDKDRADKSAQVYRFDYLVSEGMSNLTDNLATNVHYATLGDLYNDELLQLENGNENLLEEPIQTSVSIGSNNFDLGLSFAGQLPADAKVKHLTIEQMIEYNMAILDIVNNLNS